MTPTSLLLLLAYQYAPPLPATAHKVVAAATVMVVSGDRREVRDLFALAHRESRWTPGARSGANACGLFQVIGKWQKTTCRALQENAIHSTLTAIHVWRSAGRACGLRGQRTCYGAGHWSKAGTEARRLYNERRW